LRRVLGHALDRVAAWNVDAGLASRWRQVADAVDEEAGRKRFRAAVMQGDLAELKRLAQAGEPLPDGVVVLLADAFHRHQAWAEAVELLRRARQQSPADFRVHFLLGQSLAEKRFRGVRAEEGELEEEVASWRAALALRPNNYAVHTSLGSALKARGQLDEAIALLRQAIALDPWYALAHNNLGNLLKDKGQVDEAIAAYRQAIAIDPRSALAHNNLGVALEARGQLDEAIAAHRQAIRLDPRYAGAHTNLGNALQARGQVDEAIAAHRQAIRLDPGLAQPHTNLGNALRARGRLDEAIVACHEAVRLDPGFAQAHYNLGIALSARGRLDEAIVACREAVRLDPGLALAHYTLGVTLRARGQVDEAIAAYRQAIRLDPRYANAHTNLGNALVDKGQLDEAITPLCEATRLDPKSPNAHGALGQALMRQGKFGEARAATRRCLDLLPTGDPRGPLAAQQLQECDGWLALEERLPAILQGRVDPADVAERLALAQLCLRYKQRYAAATRFYAEAFAAQPPLAEDLRAGHRYNAACAAALAGAGQGADPAGPGDAERAGFRRYALTWLRADLAVWARVGQGPPQARQEVARQLQHWLKDSDLAGLRDPQPIARLPAEERPACQRLWADVAAVLRQAEGQP
jgi:tetratricopeptide (TPR) repeat protein